MAKRRRDDASDDQPPARPTEPAEDGDRLTEEDEAALDAAAAQMPDEVRQASREWVRSWAEPLGEWVPEEESEKKP